MALQHIFIQVFWYSMSVVIPCILHTNMNSYTYKISTQEHGCVCVCECECTYRYTHTHTHLRCGILGVLLEHIIKDNTTHQRTTSL